MAGLRAQCTALMHCHRCCAQHPPCSRACGIPELMLASHFLLLVPLTKRACSFLLSMSAFWAEGLHRAGQRRAAGSAEGSCSAGVETAGSWPPQLLPLLASAHHAATGATFIEPLQQQQQQQAHRSQPRMRLLCGCSHAVGCTPPCRVLRSPLPRCRAAWPARWLTCCAFRMPRPRGRCASTSGT